jgi:hypothetical protein
MEGLKYIPQLPDNPVHALLEIFPAKNLFSSNAYSRCKFNVFYINYGAWHNSGPFKNKSF